MTTELFSSFGPFMTKAEVAKTMKVSTDTVDKWARQGLRCFKAGHNVRFLTAAVVEWVQRRTA